MHFFWKNRFIQRNSNESVINSLYVEYIRYMSNNVIISKREISISAINFYNILNVTRNVRRETALPSFVISLRNAVTININIAGIIGFTITSVSRLVFRIILPRDRVVTEKHKEFIYTGIEDSNVRNDLRR